MGPVVVERPFRSGPRFRSLIRVIGGRDLCGLQTLLHPKAYSALQPRHERGVRTLYCGLFQVGFPPSMRTSRSTKNTFVTTILAPPPKIAGTAVQV